MKINPIQRSDTLRTFHSLRNTLLSTPPILSDEEYLSLAQQDKQELRRLFPMEKQTLPFAADLPQSAKIDDFSRTQEANIIKLRRAVFDAAARELTDQSFNIFCKNLPSVVCASSIYYNCIPIVQTLIFKDNTTFKLDGRVKFFKFLSKFPLSPAALSLAEEIRLAQSRVSPNRRIEGTLTISISPVDYLTLSDDTSGWTSCLRTLPHSGKRGDYCAGTLEMLSSPYAFVAYIAAPDGRKYWRQLFLYTPYAIIALRPYPYEFPQATEQVFQIVLMASQRTYSETPIISSGAALTLPNSSSLVLTTNLMFNDAIRGVEYLPRIREELEFAPREKLIELNFSGPAYCLSCGSRMEDLYSGSGEHNLECPTCLGLRKCYCCGEWKRITYPTVTGEELCEYCKQDLDEEFSADTPQGGA